MFISKKPRDPGTVRESLGEGWGRCLLAVEREKGSTFAAVGESFTNLYLLSGFEKPMFRGHFAVHQKNSVMLGAEAASPG
jgi:hypothetical protein